jgi:hypothetical protein
MLSQAWAGKSELNVGPGRAWAEEMYDLGHSQTGLAGRGFTMFGPGSGLIFAQLWSIGPILEEVIILFKRMAKILKSNYLIKKIFPFSIT